MLEVPGGQEQQGGKRDGGYAGKQRPRPRQASSGPPVLVKWRGARAPQDVCGDHSARSVVWLPRPYQLSLRVASMVVPSARKSSTLPISSELSSESSTP